MSCNRYFDDIQYVVLALVNLQCLFTTFDNQENTSPNIG